MGALEQARAHLDKAKEFLESAWHELALERFNTATSAAVTSGINSKDALCMKLAGRTEKTENHAAAVKELEKAGPAGKQAAPDLRRLLALKSKAQYQSVSVASKQAENAVKWAERIYSRAEAVVRA